MEAGENEKFSKCYMMILTYRWWVLIEDILYT